MTKKTRTILFLICLFSFILIAPSTVLYSQGYRFDLENKKLTQTGGFFLKVEPKQVDIYIDGKLKKKTDFFFGSTLIENLLPKKYKIQIKKEGYHSWEKNLEIKEKEVVEAKNIVLFPENPNFSILIGGVKKLWFSPDEKKIILVEKTEAGWSLKLYDLERNIKSHLVDELSFISPLRSAREIDDKDVNPPTKISGGGADLLNLEFSKDSKEIYLNIGLQPTLHPPASGPLKEEDYNPATTLPLVKDERTSKNFALKLDKLPQVLTERKITPTPEDIVTSQLFNDDVYYLDTSGHLFKNPSGAKGEDEGFAFIDYKEKLTEKPFPVKAETEYVLEKFQNFIFLRENQVLYQFNFDTKSFEKFFEGIKGLKISPDNKKMVLFSDYEIWILFLKEIISQPQRKEGEQLFLVRLSEKIGDCFWLNPDYLIFNAANKIKIAEIDDRDRANIIDIAEDEESKLSSSPFVKTRELEDTKIFWNQFDKKLYILSGENLYQSEKLLP